ncbi:MAG TPA: hypothetical protein VGD29_10640 [Actinoplanes sp.]
MKNPRPVLAATLTRAPAVAGGAEDDRVAPRTTGRRQGRPGGGAKDDRAAAKPVDPKGALAASLPA